jgi:hypothetical protein
MLSKGRHTHDYDQGDAVGKRQHATEAIELRLNSRVTVHLSISSAAKIFCP